MLLGALLEKLNDQAFAVEAVLSLGDLGLLMRVEKMAAENNLDVGEVVSQSVHNFTAHADADQWVQLMSVINRSDDPGGAALKRMLETALRHD